MIGLSGVPLKNDYQYHVESEDSVVGWKNPQCAAKFKTMSTTDINTLAKTVPKCESNVISETITWRSLMLLFFVS